MALLHANETLVEKYRIDSLLGEGGMGDVYAATNLWTHRRVAIKVLHAELNESPEAVQRFWLEAQSASRIEHAHVIQILDMGHDAERGVYYLVEELLRGDDLRKHLLRVGRMDVRAVVSVLEPVLDGLSNAHHAGIVHRDLKPENIVLIPDSLGGFTPKIIDFGIAKTLQSGNFKSTSRTATRAGTVMGTPEYMSPEQARGDVAVDARTDVWAVGMIAYEMLSGRVAFHAATENLVLLRVMTESVEPLELHAPQLPESVISWVRRALCTNREERFADAGEMLEALRALKQELLTLPSTRARTVMSGELPKRPVSSPISSRKLWVMAAGGSVLLCAFWFGLKRRDTSTLSAGITHVSAAVANDAALPATDVHREAGTAPTTLLDAASPRVETLDATAARTDTSVISDAAAPTPIRSLPTRTPSTGTRVRAVHPSTSVTHETTYELQ